MPTVLRKYGFRFHFFGSDMAEPRHIHVSAHDGKAKIWLEPVRVEEAKGFNAGDMRRILGVVEEHRGEFLEAWDEFFKSVS
jgi:hypothetical protein